MDTPRNILLKVKDGSLSPEEAAARLERLEGAESDARGDHARGGSEQATPVRRIKVLGDFRTARIVGDPDVAAAVAEGPHSARHEGETLVIDARHDELEGDHEFRFTRHQDRPRIVIGLGTRPQPVSIRMNPDLPLEVDIDAGSASINGVRAAIKAQIDAGSIKIEGAESAFDLSVDAGSVSVGARLTEGESKISCDAGSVKVMLRKGSSVRVRATADIGKVTLGRAGFGGMRIGSQAHEAVFGEGAGSLTISGSIGRVLVDEE
jgi:hypothetical protein